MPKRKKIISKGKELKKLAILLEKQIKQEKRESVYVSVKEVLSFLAKGSILAFSLVAPKTLRLLKSSGRQYEAGVWKRYNLSYLKRTIRRLEKQKLVEIKEQGKQQVIRISQAGKEKVLRYAIGALKIKIPESWDQRWRIVIYDVPEKRKNLRALLRNYLKNLGFVEIQKSVYLTPFPCEEQIEFLRSFYDLGENIRIIRADKIENEKTYKEYFDI